MKSSVAFMATTAAVSLMLAGCASDSGGGEGGSQSLEVQTGFAVDAGEMATLKALTDAFMQENPDIDVELVPASASYEKDIKVRLASDNTPDIWNTHGWSLLRYSDFLLPLQNEPWADEVNKTLDPVMKSSSGEIYAMPTNTDLSGILYNVDVLADAGKSADDIETWDDFMEVSLAIKENGVTPVYVAGAQMAPAIADRVLSGAYDEASLEKMADGTFVADGYKDTLELISEWRDAGLFNADYSSATSDDMAKALAQGQAGFEFGPSFLADSAMQYNPDANLGFMPIPSMVGGPRYLISGENTAFGISKNSEHIDAAKTYLAYLAQPDNVTQMAKASSSPAGLSSADTDLGVLQSSYDTYITEADTTVVPYFDRVYMPNGAWSTMRTTTDSVITAQATVDAALDQVESTYMSLSSKMK